MPEANNASSTARWDCAITSVAAWSASTESEESSTTCSTPATFAAATNSATVPRSA